jgi:hypothetical protein
MNKIMKTTFTSFAMMTVFFILASFNPKGLNAQATCSKPADGKEQSCQCNLPQDSKPSGQSESVNPKTEAGPSQYNGNTGNKIPRLSPYSPLRKRRPKSMLS